MGYYTGVSLLVLLIALTIDIGVEGKGRYLTNIECSYNINILMHIIYLIFIYS